MRSQVVGLSSAKGEDVEPRREHEQSGRSALSTPGPPQGFAPVSPEALAKAAPQVLIVTTTGLASIGGLKALLKIPGIAQTTAGRTKDVLAFEDDFLLNDSTRVGQLMQRLAVNLHRDCAAMS